MLLIPSNGKQRKNFMQKAHTHTHTHTHTHIYIYIYIYMCVWGHEMINM